MSPTRSGGRFSTSRLSSASATKACSGSTTIKATSPVPARHFSTHNRRADHTTGVYCRAMRGILMKTLKLTLLGASVVGAFVVLAVVALVMVLSSLPDRVQAQQPSSETVK